MKTKDSVSRASTLSGKHQVAASQPTDEELIATFMEKRPGPNEHGGTGLSAGNWWFWGGSWEPRELTLDALHEVEERLSAVHHCPCMSLIASEKGLFGRFYEDAWVYLHATAATKIKALAAVLRTQVTK